LKAYKTAFSPPFFSGKHAKTFAFDHCFSSNEADDVGEDQERVFEALGKDILANAFEGYNACIFAYGQTGTKYYHNKNII
jgi:hypothetical protein